ncbi:MAG: choice-of-anchor H family protein [Pseudomonadota bacterium]
MKTRALTRYATAALLIALTGSAFAMDAVDSRVSESRYYTAEARADDTPNRVSTDEFTSADEGRRSRGQEGVAQPRGKDSSVATLDGTGANIDFWIYSADVELFADEDRDGFFSGIDLLFDVDTIYGRAEVYAVVYLSREGGPWMEYAETEDFVIHGTSGNDEFSVVTELLAGYPAGDYDVLIEIYDTFDNGFVADLGPEQSSALSFLPLEDAERDAPVIENRTVVVSRTGGGGSADALTLAGLLLLTAWVVYRRRVGISV